MERSLSTRKRRQGPGQPAKPPARLSREKRRQQDGEKVHATKTSYESSRGPIRASGSEQPSVDDDHNARSFTVGNVGRNGTLYLKPSRVTPPQLTKPPATPPASAGKKKTQDTGATSQRNTSISDSTTSRGYPFKMRGNALNRTGPIPPLGTEDQNQHGRVRSHSFSTIDQVVKAPKLEAAEFQVLLNGQQPRKRSKSSVDLSRDLLNFRIPHYRLGTPRFSDLGTAYLHNSVTSSMVTKSITEDMRSSNTSRPDFNRFPAPPGRDLGLSFASSQYSGASFLHPSRAASLLTPTRTPTQSAPRGGGGINVAMYDHVEANINNASLVRYSPSTGRITAATPARLIAQITSPWFLDYELLSDFFLTYRNFLTRHDLLNYLLVRMKWALANESDSGRIVTVRTFVALRHWILNYFEDDFIPDPELRQRLCDQVNEIADALRQRADGGGGNLNVIGELKKCWRRICAMFWSVEDLPETTPDVDIHPGEEDYSSRVRASATSMVQSAPHESMHMDFRRSSIIPLPALAENAENEAVVEDPDDNAAARALRVANIPTSPASTHSMQVLSCSVPFLKNIVATREKPPAPRPLEAPKAPSEKSILTARRHHRSGSFSDALRDDRAPLASGQPESVDFRSLPHMSFTGGLVRGLLLQPSPSNVDLVIPISPPLDLQDFDFGFSPTDTAKSIHDSQQSSAGVKKIVGDVRRALSGRKRDSPTSSHRSTSSSESRNSGHSGQHDRYERPSSWQRLQGPPRIDVLGERIKSTYGEALHGLVDPQNAQPISGDLTSLHDRSILQPPFFNRDNSRLNTGSHVTTGSRSIVIVDDTWLLPNVPAIGSAVNSLSPRSGALVPEPVSINSRDSSNRIQPAEYQSWRNSSPAVAGGNQQQISEPPLHDLLALPESWQGVPVSDSGLGVGDPRKSSDAQPFALDMPPIQQQLRRRPGGDLKAVDHVHNLEYTPRPATADSSSAFSQAIFTSGVPSVDVSAANFPEHDGNGVQHPPSHLRGKTKDSWTLLPTHSSQPNMRASMKAQVSHLAKLPDDVSDGGVEDTLAKLEGKAASPTASTHAIAARDADSEMSPTTQSPRGPLRVTNLSATQSVDEPRSPTTDRQGASIFRMSADTHLASVAGGRALGDDSTMSGQAPVRDVPIQEAPSSEPPEEDIRSAGPQSSTQRSFLLDGDDTASDISSEMEEEPPVEDNLGVRSFYFDDTQLHDKRMPPPFKVPPTPPPTVAAATGQSSQASPVHRRTISEPKRSLKEATAPSRTNLRHQHRMADPRRSHVAPSQKGTAHLPFVLAFESDIIAEQLTIIEKDALDEIDWKDLIALNWQHAPLHIRNWVDFLKRDDCNGIDIVVSRFNLVVKWVVSECILTEVPSERARVIAKYIHIAAYAHRLRNYATMYQITLALLSSDMARLHNTWKLVGTAEKQLLHRLEKLCNPRNNFHQLRVEMESASVEDACIPFIGLWTHDLMFNAQKTSRFESTLPKGEALINFERFQTAATLVKSLLTLIEASSKYVFKPHPEVLSRCLWLAALEDEEITFLSKTSEQ